MHLCFFHFRKAFECLLAECFKEKKIAQTNDAHHISILCVYAYCNVRFGTSVSRLLVQNFLSYGQAGVFATHFEVKMIPNKNTRKWVHGKQANPWDMDRSAYLSVYLSISAAATFASIFGIHI